MKKKPSLDDKIKDAAKRTGRLQTFGKGIVRDGQMDLTSQQRANLKLVQGGMDR